MKSINSVEPPSSKITSGQSNYQPVIQWTIKLSASQPVIQWTIKLSASHPVDNQIISQSSSGQSNYQPVNQWTIKLSASHPADNQIISQSSSGHSNQPVISSWIWPCLENGQQCPGIPGTLVTSCRGLHKIKMSTWKHTTSQWLHK